MESQIRKSALFDVLDGIPPTGNKSIEVMSYRKKLNKVI